MANFLTICYKPCEPAPANGYPVVYRPSGSSEPLREWPNNFFPTTYELQVRRAQAKLLVTADPDGTQYEGFIYGDCPAGLGVGVPWKTGDNPGESDSGSSPSSSDSIGEGVVLGVIKVFDCVSTGRILNIKWHGNNVPLLVGSYPIAAGEDVTTGFIETGTGTLEVVVDGLFTSISIKDSTNPDITGFPATACQAFTGASSYFFHGVHLNSAVLFKVWLDCVPC